LYEREAWLGRVPGCLEPLWTVHEMEEPGFEIHLLLEFRHGLHTISDTGGIRPAVGGVVVEYNDADGPDDDELNPYRPAAFQPDRNADWTDRFDGGPVPAGVWLTEAGTIATVERRIVYRFPSPGRYRVRVKALFDDTGRTRRVPTLVGVAEVRDLVPAGPEVVVEPEPVVEVVVAPPVFAAPRLLYLCPFCGRRGHALRLRVGGVTPHHCRHCSGAVHVYADGRRRCSILHEGRRRFYDLVRGRAAGYRAPPRPEYRRPVWPRSRRRAAVARRGRPSAGTARPRPALRRPARTLPQPGRGTIRRPGVGRGFPAARSPAARPQAPVARRTTTPPNRARPRTGSARRAPSIRRPNPGPARTPTVRRTPSIRRPDPGPARTPTVRRTPSIRRPDPGPLRTPTARRAPSVRRTPGPLRTPSARRTPTVRRPGSAARRGLRTPTARPPASRPEPRARPLRQRPAAPRRATLQRRLDRAAPRAVRRAPSRAAPTRAPRPRRSAPLRRRRHAHP
ncbi:MAG: hypothetical protein ACE5JG_01570, partial [Planctomycetota bacterium]